MAVVWNVNMTSGFNSVGGSGFQSATNSSLNSDSGSLSDSTADMYSGAACYALRTNLVAFGTGFTGRPTFEFAGNVSGGWTHVEIANTEVIPYSDFTRTVETSPVTFTRFKIDDSSKFMTRLNFPSNGVFNFKFHNSAPDNGYGTRVFNEDGQLAFDSGQASYARVTSSGTVVLANNASTTINASGVGTGSGHVYFTIPDVNVQTPFTVTFPSNDSFTVTNKSGTTTTFGYVAFRYQ